MTTSSAQLLRLLEPSVRPAFAQPPAAQRSALPIDQQSFSQLLDAARHGHVHSGRQVEVSCELASPLSAAQLEKLAAAADSAEASGARNALMMMDGRGFVMDVQNRTIIAELSSATAAPPIPVDVAMNVSGDGSSAMAPKLPPAGNGVLPASLSGLFTRAFSS